MIAQPASDQRRVLIAYAGGAPGHAAVCAAARLFPGAEAVVLCVVEPLPVAPVGPILTMDAHAYAGPLPTGGLADTARECAEAGRDAAADLGLAAEAVTAKGTQGVADAILSVARDRDVDAVVLASHGRSPLLSLLTGSTSGTVAREASRPVVVVPAPEDD